MKKRVCILCGEEDADMGRQLSVDLRLSGISAWLLTEDLFPGCNINSEIRKQILDRDFAICILSEVSQSQGGIYHTALNKALAESEKKPPGTIFLIPASTDGCGIADERLASLQCEDLRFYKRALNRILKVILPNENRPVGSVSNPPGSDSESQAENSFLYELFKKFESKCRAVLLFAQEEREHVMAVNHLLRHAKTLFGSANVFHVIPPPISEIDPVSYFSCLLKQCESAESVSNVYDFMQFFENRLEKQNRLLFLISHFEQGNDVCTSELAAILRSLNEKYYPHFNILICGGEKLARVYFGGGSLSLLNHAEVMHWPELSEEDVRLLFSQKNLDTAAAKWLLGVSGGHPRIIETLLETWKNIEGITENEIIIPEKNEFQFIWRTFARLGKDRETGAKICELLEQDPVSSWQPYHTDLVVSKLYWKNLLKRDETAKTLSWRSRLIVEIGRHALGCRE